LNAPQAHHGGDHAVETGGGVRSVLVLHQERTQAHVPGGDFSGPSSWQSGKHQAATQRVLQEVVDMAAGWFNAPNNDFSKRSVHTNLNAVKILVDGQARIVEKIEHVERELGAMIKFSYAELDRRTMLWKRKCLR
jgi:hypothetical protein